jgi:pyruvate, orthophosphate dikinase
VVDVPEGFIISTSVTGNITTGIEQECRLALRKLEQRTHRLYDPKNRGEIPLLLSIRGSPTKPVHGSPFSSFPSPWLTIFYRLMHSILNVGINDEIVEILAEMPGANRKFALDTYQRFLQMFGCNVLQVDPKLYDDALKAQKIQEGVESETELSEEGLEHLVHIFKLIANVPQDPMTQFWMIIQKLYETFK